MDGKVRPASTRALSGQSHLRVSLQLAALVSTKSSQAPVPINGLPSVVSYKKLLIHSFALQQALERDLRPEDYPIISQCMQHARAVLDTFLEKLAPSGLMYYAPNGKLFRNRPLLSSSLEFSQAGLTTARLLLHSLSKYVPTSSSVGHPLIDYRSFSALNLPHSLTVIQEQRFLL
jgi:hypothetical protein